MHLLTIIISAQTDPWTEVLLPILLALAVVLGGGYMVFRANWVAAIQNRRVQTALDIEELLVEVERRVAVGSLSAWADVGEVEIFLRSAIRRARMFSDTRLYNDRQLTSTLQMALIALDKTNELFRQGGGRIMPQTPAWREATLEYGHIADAISSAQKATAAYVVKPRLSWNP